jgi:TRAP-type mannitol/chloroaromatic compound transport system substrate-binding protein
MYEGFARFSQKVTDATGGMWVLEPHPGGAIVPASDEVYAVDTGTLDYSYDATSWWRERFPAAGLFNFYVGGLSPMAMLFWMHDEGTEMLQEMLDGAGMNVKVIPGWTGTPEIFLSSTVALDTPADLKGIKMRTAGDDGSIFARMDVSVMSVPGGELYEAVQRGVVDCFQFSSPAVDYTIATYEIIDYMYLSAARQPCEYLTYSVNKDSWAALPPEYQKIFQAVAWQECIDYLSDITRKDMEAIAFYQDYGTTVAPASQSIIDALMIEAKAFYDEQAAEDTFYAKVLESARTFKKGMEDTYPGLF